MCVLVEFVAVAVFAAIADGSLAEQDVASDYPLTVANNAGTVCSLSYDFHSLCRQAFFLLFRKDSGFLPLTDFNYHIIKASDLSNEFQEIIKVSRTNICQ